MTRQDAAIAGTPAGGALIDVLDRVLDKGLRVEMPGMVAPVGVDLTSFPMRVEVAACEVWLRHELALDVPVRSGLAAMADEEGARRHDAELARRLDELRARGGSAR